MISNPNNDDVSQLVAEQGVAEKHSEVYMRYTERASQDTTKFSARNQCSASSSAARQVLVGWRLS